jgi:hypothetical protein
MMTHAYMSHFLQVKQQGILYQNSDHMLCAFHLTNQNYDKHVSSSHIYVKPSWSTAKEWMYSWITSCETQNEYLYSRAKFHEWLKLLCEESDVLPQAAQFCRETAEYVAVHLDPHESRWV